MWSSAYFKLNTKLWLFERMVRIAQCLVIKINDEPALGVFLEESGLLFLLLHVVLQIGDLN